jgi:ribosomal protein L3 glutamine methyltransferase
MKNKFSIKKIVEDIAKRFEDADIHFGHGTDNAWDEAVALVFHVLQLAFDVDDEKILRRQITAGEMQNINELVERRIKEKIPLAYLTHEAYFANLKFYVDERVIIPRSPFAELILNQFSPWVEYEKVNNILDLCAGSGCMAIACAKAFPHAKIDAVDLSADALEIAKINVEKLKVVEQINLIQADLFAKIKNKKYDLIISNPPYVGNEEMKSLPQEYQHEPNMSLETAEDGLGIVLRILQQAKNHLTKNGVLIVEVGNSRSALEKRLPNVPFIWLEFANGGEGVFLLTGVEVSKC